MNDKVKPVTVTRKTRSKRVTKEIRQRVRRYCCKCKKETGRSGTNKKAGVYKIENVKICSIYKHRSCQVCLYKNLAKRSESKPLRDTVISDNSATEPATMQLKAI